MKENDISLTETISNPNLEKREKTVLENGNSYEGYWRIGTEIREGHGTELFVDGSSYTGEYKENYRTGKGKLVLITGYEYEGYFKNDTYHGFGKMKYPDGRYYEGQFSLG